MLTVNNVILLLLIVLAGLTLPLFKGRYFDIVLAFTIALSPYVVATFRSRDFLDANRILAVIAMGCLIVNMILCGSNIYKYDTFILLNIITSTVCCIITSMLYNMIYLCSEAYTEFRRFEAATDYVILMHNAVILVFGVMFFKRLNVSMLNMWFFILLTVLTGISNRIIMFMLAKMTLEEVGVCNEGIKRAEDKA